MKRTKPLTSYAHHPMRFIFEIAETKTFQKMRLLPTSSMFYFPNPEEAEIFIDAFNKFTCCFCGTLTKSQVRFFAKRINRMVKDYKTICI